MGRKLIETPGYHILPKYDLEGLRKRNQQNGGRDLNVVLPLTSLIDMFSMLVIFLLLNFSATGEAFFVSKGVKLPEAQNAKRLESFPLISITKKGIYLDSRGREDMPSWVPIDDIEMLPIVRELKRIKSIEANFAQAGLKARKTQINIQADQKMPVRYIKRVMTVLIENGFSGINFAVDEPIKK